MLDISTLSQCISAAILQGMVLSLTFTSSASASSLLSEQTIFIRQCVVRTALHCVPTSKDVLAKNDVYLVLTEKCLHGTLAPILHSSRQASHCNGVDPQEVANKDNPSVRILRCFFGCLLPVCSLTLTAEPGKGTDVVGDHHEGGSCKILFGSPTRLFRNVHLPEAGGHNFSRQTKPSTAC